MSTSTYIEVNMQDVIGDYDIPENQVEWQWVMQHAQFHHNSNGKEPGVWEYILVVPESGLFRDFMDICEAGFGTIPERLAPILRDAYDLDATLILFYQ